MSNLIPQKRLDKNGRLVTRHVKDGKQAAASKLPAPASPRSAAEILDITDAAVRRVCRSIFTPSADDPSTYMKIDGTEVAKGLQMILSTVSNQTLDALAERGESLTGIEKGVITETFCELERYSSEMLGKTDDVESMLHYSAELAPVISQFSDGQDNTVEMHHIAMYINSRVSVMFPGREHRRMVADQSEKHVVRGFTACYCITRDDRHKISIQDLSWIGDNLDVIQPYKEILRAHDRMDREFIQELLETEAPSLTGGYL